MKEIPSEKGCQPCCPPSSTLAFCCCCCSASIVPVFPQYSFLLHNHALDRAPHAAPGHTHRPGHGASPPFVLRLRQKSRVARIASFPASPWESCVSVIWSKCQTAVSSSHTALRKHAPWSPRRYIPHALIPHLNDYKLAVVLVAFLLFENTLFCFRRNALLSYYVPAASEYFPLIGPPRKASFEADFSPASRPPPTVSPPSFVPGPASSACAPRPYRTAPSSLPTSFHIQDFLLLPYS